MKKTFKSSKKLLFENMIKLNPDFSKKSKINEEYSIMGSYKGHTEKLDSAEDDQEANYLKNEYQMALKNDYVVWIEKDGKRIDEYAGINYKIRVNKIKEVIDNLLLNQEYDSIDSLFQLLVGRKINKISTPVNENISANFKNKVEQIKGKIDFLYDSSHFDVIEKIDSIINKLYPMDSIEMDNN